MHFLSFLIRIIIFILLLLFINIINNNMKMSSKRLSLTKQRQEKQKQQPQGNILNDASPTIQRMGMDKTMEKEEEEEEEEYHKNSNLILNKNDSKNQHNKYNENNHTDHPMQEEEEEDLTSERKPADSAYIQHLAEICYLVRNDARYFNLFKWQYGDDLSAVNLLQSYCKLYKSTEEEKLDEEKEMTEVVDLERDRAVLLYCRLYLRKGPYFRLDDLFIRYYAKNGQDYTEDSVESLLSDLTYLTKSGLIRTFHDEMECLEAIANDSRMGKKGILTSKEYCQLVKILGGHLPKSSPADCKEDKTKNVSQSFRSCQFCCSRDVQNTQRLRNNLMKLAKSQRSLFHYSKAEGQAIPIRKNLSRILLDSTLDKMVPNQKLEQIKNRRKKLKARLERFTNKEGFYVARLREEPLVTLRRCCRVFVCAGNGPGNMRGDAWIDCHRLNAKTDDVDEGIAVISPIDNSWHSNVQYPGLQQLFSLKHYEMQDCFQHVHCNKATTKDCLFKDVFALRKWENAVYIRHVTDYLVEAFDVCRMMKKREMGLEISADTLGILDNNDQSSFLMNLAYPHQLPQRFAQKLKNITEDMSILINHSEQNDQRCGMFQIQRAVSYLGLWIAASVSNHLRGLSFAKVKEAINKPYLRHMTFEGVLFYCIWDLISIIEKSGNYNLSLYLLSLIVGEEEAYAQHNLPLYLSTYIPLILSRRSRGKAYERLLVDRGHLLRKRKKGKNLETESLEKDEANFYFKTIEQLCKTDSIPFSFSRNIARRIKRPLSDTMNGIFCSEHNYLSIRLQNDIDSSSDLTLINDTSLAEIENVNNSGSRKAKKSRHSLKQTEKICTLKQKYVDWVPYIDVSVANTINTQHKQGSRCRFLGWEDDDENKKMLSTKSLNVEELAMEEYYSGRLPNKTSIVNGDSLLGGNWIGWHDEGSIVRSLFRILCWKDLLIREKNVDNGEISDVFMTPYQTNGHDLHVANVKVVDCDNKVQEVGSFHQRYNSEIKSFLLKIENSSGDELCIMVYNSVKDRLYKNKIIRTTNDTRFRDAKQVKTLSMVAVGLGGKVLAAIFRALFFDYRHYSGGLPDLLLCRAYYINQKKDEKENLSFVSLSDWIGEGFDNEALEAEEQQRIQNILFDREGEFLGCSKSSDTTRVGRNSKSRSNFQTSQLSKQKEELASFLFPLEPLKLQFDDKFIHVECMFVEVKSSNDRLDARQEDWLNILDAAKPGYARVCKFMKTKNKMDVVPSRA